MAPLLMQNIRIQNIRLQNISRVFEAEQGGEMYFLLLKIPLHINFIFFCIWNSFHNLPFDVYIFECFLHQELEGGGHVGSGQLHVARVSRLSCKSVLYH